MEPEDAGRICQTVASGYRTAVVPTTASDLIDVLKDSETDVGIFISGSEGSGEISLPSGNSNRLQGIREEEPEMLDSRKSRVERSDQNL